LILRNPIPNAKGPSANIKIYTYIGCTTIYNTTINDEHQRKIIYKSSTNNNINILYNNELAKWVATKVVKGERSRSYISGKQSFV